ACEKQFPDAHKRPVSPRIACFNLANLRYQEAMDRSVGNPNLDLVRTLHAKLSLAGETYDAKKLTPAQYDLAKAQAISDFTDLIEQRKHGRAMANAAQTQAAAVQSQAAAAIQANIQANRS